MTRGHGALEGLPHALGEERRLGWCQIHSAFCVPCNQTVRYSEKGANAPKSRGNDVAGRVKMRQYCFSLPHCHFNEELSYSTGANVDTPLLRG